MLKCPRPSKRAPVKFFLNGPGGTGKTFVYNTVCNTIRSKGWIALCAASSGIAALSMFKIPLNPDEKATAPLQTRGISPISSEPRDSSSGMKLQCNTDMLPKLSIAHAATFSKSQIVHLVELLSSSAGISNKFFRSSGTAPEQTLFCLTSPINVVEWDRGLETDPEYALNEQPRLPQVFFLVA